MSFPKLAREAYARTSVLIVDDDPEFGRVASDLLADLGYHVLGQATTAAQAVADCKRLDPDAVLVDVRLPDGDGVTLADALLDGGNRPKILLTSTDGQAVTPERLRRSGADGFVPKTELARTNLDAFLRS